jgi:peptide/nickel transport system permease protein
MAQRMGRHHLYGLDQPAPVRYVIWLAAMQHGDFGTPVASHQPVAGLIAERLPNTLLLQGLALLVPLGTAQPLGVLAATRQPGLTIWPRRSAP